MKHAFALLAAFLLAFLPARADEVPFVVTPDNVTLAMLQLANVGPEDYVIDLGSGDGRIVITAARRFGARGLGIEIVPDLVAKSRENARAAGVATRALFREQDLFQTDLSPASVVTMYLLPEANLQLRPKILRLRPGTRIVSHDWDMAEWQPDRVITVPAPDKSVGVNKSSKLHLWIVPARFQGGWCGTGKAKGATLRLAQEFQRFRGELTKGDDKREFEGRINGYAAGVPRQVNLHLEGDKVRLQAIDRKYSPFHRALFTRQRAGACK
ncbi:MAG TPA: methyltransferase domain-containing protein [Usitatibacter sp.]|nr:methyltransferase domain-containing protein [Usitatibacter sp.]